MFRVKTPGQGQGRKTPNDPKAAATPVEDDEGKTELTDEIEIMNTPHHKAIVKARNEFYKLFKDRFEYSVEDITKRYDDLRLEECKFN